MSQLLSAVWNLILGVFNSILELIVVCGVSIFDVLYSLHVNAPRLEGLIVGVLFTWVLLKRDKHPLLRVLSAPLKLVLDILDLAWDQAGEVLGDIKGTVVKWIRSCSGWVSLRLRNAWAGVLGRLASIRDRLLRRKNK